MDETTSLKEAVTSSMKNLEVQSLKRLGAAAVNSPKFFSFAKLKSFTSFL